MWSGIAWMRGATLAATLACLFQNMRVRGTVKTKVVGENTDSFDTDASGSHALKGSRLPSILPKQGVLQFRSVGDRIATSLAARISVV